MLEVIVGLVIGVAGASVASLFYVHSVRRAAQVEAEKARADKATLDGQMGEVRARISDLEADKDDLTRRLEAEHTIRVQAETRLEEEQKNLREQEALLDSAREEFRDSFKALSADALQANRNEFLTQADQKMKPLQDLIATYGQQLKEIEKARNTAYGGLDQHLSGLREAQKVLEKETQQLATALRNPAVCAADGANHSCKGSWKCACPNSATLACKEHSPRRKGSAAQM